MRSVCSLQTKSIKRRDVMSVNRVKKAFTNIPATLVEVTGFIIAIAEKQRAINEAKRNAKKKIELINLELNARVAVLKCDRDTFFNALFAFAQPRKAELTKDARSVSMEAGTFGWRWTPPSIVFKYNMSEESMIAYLEEHGYKDYVRVVKEVNREALLRDRPEIARIIYEQREEFFAKPKLLRAEGSAEELRTAVIDSL